MTSGGSELRLGPDDEGAPAADVAIGVTAFAAGGDDPRAPESACPEGGSEDVASRADCLVSTPVVASPAQVRWVSAALPPHPKAFLEGYDRALRQGRGRPGPGRTVRISRVGTLP